MLLTACGCSDNPVSSDRDTGPAPDASETIGPAGGILEAEGVSLYIPAGAFSAAAELKLYKNTHDDFSGNSVTEAVEVGGLPSSWNTSLRLSLACSGALSAESYIAMGAWNYDLTESDTTLMYSLHPASDSSGYLVTSLPPVEAKSLTKPVAAGTAAEERVRFRGLNNYIMITDIDHFLIYYPEDVGPQIIVLESILEECYNTLTEELDFSYTGKSRKLPLEVTVTDIKSRSGREVHADGGFYGISGSIFNTNLKGIPYLSVSKSSLATGRLAEIKKQIGQNLTHITLTMYGGLNNTLLRPNHRWLAAAVFNWSEELFSQSGSFKVPRLFRGHEIAPFEGLRSGAGADLRGAENHGRGMSALIKYLADKQIFGLQGPAAVYEKIRTGIDPAEALITSVNSLIANWLPDFFHEYVNGNIYNVDPDFFLDPDNICRTWDVTGAEDTVMVFTSSDVEHYDNLSAKLFMINVEYDGFTDTDNLLIDAEGRAADNGIGVIVFGVKDGSLEFLGKTKNGSADVELQDLKDYYDKGWQQFLVVVVNSQGLPPYTGDSDIDLLLKIRSDPQLPEYTQCGVMVQCERTYFREYSNGSSDYQTRDDKLQTHGFYEGSFTGNTFTGSYSYTSNPSYTVQGSITAVLNPQKTRVQTVQWEETYSHTGSNYVEVIQFSAEDLLYDSSYYGATAYTVQGAETENHITDLKHTLSSDPLDYYVQSISGNSDSRIYVWFR